MGGPVVAPSVDPARLGREYLLAGHLIDRAGMPAVVKRWGQQVMTEVAIEEWMGASPVYTGRVRRALGISGDDVPAIFKAMQLDIGAPHEFMDFRYRVTHADHGEFWLASCGALVDVEPMGEQYVVGMCHHIEDPTFDATATATNPRARMRPVHRPPRRGDHHPHCHWTVEIDPSADPLPEPEAAVRVGSSRAASLVLEPDAAPSYDGPFDPDFRLEKLPPDALARALEEVCLQGHLLAHSFMVSVARRWGPEVARDMGAEQLTGVGAVVATRLARLVGADVGAVLELHPAFRPRAYVAASVSSRAGDVRLSIADCPALHEDDGLSWIPVLRDDPRPLEALVQAVDPRARVAPAGDLAWDITVDPSAEPATEPPEVVMTRFSSGADFEFRSRQA